MDERISAIVKWLVMAFAAGWIALTVADEIFGLVAAPGQATSEHDLLERQMKECHGSFQERYDCKSALLLVHGRNKFAYWSGQVAWVFGPPLAVFILFRLWRGRVTRREQDIIRKNRQKRMEEQSAKARARAEEEARMATITAKRAQDIRGAVAEAYRELHPSPVPTLLIDGDANEAQKIAAALRERDFFVVTTTDPDDALIGFKDLPYRIVLTETSFMTGETTIEAAIPTMRRQKTDAIFIAVSKKFTDMAPADTQQFAVIMGADLGFPKPLDVEKFTSIAHRLLAASVAGA